MSTSKIGLVSERLEEVATKMYAAACEAAKSFAHYADKAPSVDIIFDPISFDASKLIHSSELDATNGYCLAYHFTGGGSHGIKSTGEKIMYLGLKPKWRKINIYAPDKFEGDLRSEEWLSVGVAVLGSEDNTEIVTAALDAYADIFGGYEYK